jgi:hypothetical protein
VTNTVSAYLAGNDDEAAQISADEDISVTASSDVIFNAQGDSTGYGFVGSNGSRTGNMVASTARAFLGQDADILAGNDILVDATNRVEKPFIGANLSAGSGGFLGGPAGDSATIITNTAEAYAADNSRIEAGNDLTFSAANDVSAYDRATLSSAGRDRHSRRPFHHHQHQYRPNLDWRKHANSCRQRRQPAFADKGERRGSDLYRGLRPGCICRWKGYREPHRE